MLPNSAAGDGILRSKICPNFNPDETSQPGGCISFRVKKSSSSSAPDNSYSDCNPASDMVLRFGQGFRKKSNALDERDVSSANEARDMLGKNVPLFINVDKKWGWKKELLLLESVESHGLYNWERVAKVLSFKDQVFEAKEVEDHYYKFYLKGSLGNVWNHSLFLEQKCIDHILDEHELDQSGSHLYLPQVSIKKLKSIKFMPHREEFQNYPPSLSESMLSLLEFTTDIKVMQKRLGINFKMSSTFGCILRQGQLAIVDSYRRTVCEREQHLKLMQEFKLIEQYFLNGPTIMTRLKSIEASQDAETLDKDFLFLLRTVQLFPSLSAFYKFFHNCVKEKLLKMEINRLTEMLKGKKYVRREPYMQKLLEMKAPFFLNAGLLHSRNPKLRRRKQKSNFTKRKQTK